MSSSSRTELRDTDGVLLDEGADPLPETRLGDQVHLDAQEVFEKDSQLHVGGKSGRGPEAHEEVDVAVSGGFSAGYGTEEPEGFHPESLDFASMCRQQCQNVITSHDLTSTSQRYCNP